MTSPTISYSAAGSWQRTPASTRSRSGRFALQHLDRLFGCEVGPVTDLAAKVQAVYTALQPPDTDRMLDFDERDLLRLVEQAGFTEIHLQFHADIGR